MNKISERLDQIIQKHPVASMVTVTVAGYAVGTLVGHYLAKGLVKAASGNRIL